MDVGSLGWGGGFPTPLQFLLHYYVLHTARSYRAKLQRQEYMERHMPDIIIIKITIQLASVGLAHTRPILPLELNQVQQVWEVY